MEDEDLEDWDEDEDEDCVVMTQEDYFAELHEQGVDTRAWDPAFFCLRRESNSSFSRALHKPAVYVRRETLLEALRIEALRWKAFLNYSKHWDRSGLLNREIAQMPDQECFVPVDEEDLRESIEDHEELGEPLSEEEIERYSRPRRVYAREDHDGTWVTYDDDFWSYREPEHDKEVAMEVIAAAGCLGEWEQVTLPARVARSQDPDKLALGERYQSEVRRGHHLEDRCYLLNELLTASILNSDLLPEGPRLAKKMVRVRLNDRLYFFETGRHHKSAAHNLWPVPDDFDEIIVVGKLKPAGAVR